MSTPRGRVERVGEVVYVVHPIRARQLGENSPRFVLYSVLTVELRRTQCHCAFWVECAAAMRRVCESNLSQLVASSQAS